MKERIFLASVSVVLVLNYFVPVVCGAESVSAIGLTYVPKYGSTENLRGRVLNANSKDFAVAVYIKVDGLWWTKPYWDSPITEINDDGTWVCDITTGGFDETAEEIAVFLMPVRQEPPLASGEGSPTFAITGAVAEARAIRTVKEVKVLKSVNDDGRIVEVQKWVLPRPKLGGVCYGPFRDNENPDLGVFPLLDELNSDIEFIPKVAKAIRTYSSFSGHRNIPALCERVGLACYPGAWLSKYKTENRKEIEGLTQIANKNFNCVKALIMGNEVLLRKDLTEEELIDYIREVKKSTALPVTTADIWSIWQDHPRLADEVDLLMVHIHPYWEGIPIGDVASYVIQRWDAMKKRFPGKRIVIGETGWPSKGKTIGKAIASPENQARFFREFTQLAESKGIEYFFFELFDEKWKDKFEGEAGAHWGIYNSDGSLKDHLKDLVPNQALKGISRPSRKLSQIKITAPLIVYSDVGSDKNSFQPSGWMGDIECIKLDRACETNPYSGKTCVRITYNPNVFLSKRWSGIYWQYPLNNWGDHPGYELSGASRLTFYARGEKGNEMAEFKVGGIRIWQKPHYDSFGPISTSIVKLSSQWKKFTIDLKGCNMSNLIGGFCFVTNRLQNMNGCTIYLDNIQFEP